MIDIVWMIGATFVVGFVSFGLGVWLSPLVLLAITAGAVLARNARRNRAMIAAGYLEQAVRLNLPIPAMLRAAELSEVGILRRRLAKMRDAIEGGTPAAFAWQTALPGAPARVAGLIESGERLGQLPQVLARAVRHRRTRRRPAQTIILMWYPILMLLAITAIGNGVAIFAFPKLKDILTDFHLQMPAVTRMAMATLDAVQIPLLIVTAVVVIIFCGRIVSDAVPKFRLSRQPWKALADRLAWHAPIWGRLVRARGLADLCFVLGEAVDAGLPLDRALAEAAEGCDNRVLQRRVKRWSQKLMAGAATDQSARQARMPRLIVGMLATVQDARGLQNALRFLTRYYDGRHSAAAAVLEGAALPIMVAVLGVFVASLALGLFLPLVQLADHLGIPKGLL